MQIGMYLTNEDRLLCCWRSRIVPQIGDIVWLRGHTESQTLTDSFKVVRRDWCVNMIVRKDESDHPLLSDTVELWVELYEEDELVK